MKRPIKVLVFGTFDGIHDGHRHFLKEAKKHGDYLFAVVAKDEVVKILKGSLPYHNTTDRIENLSKEKLADGFLSGDLELSTWKTVKKIQPDIICLGYDQRALFKALKKELPNFSWPISLVLINSYLPRKLHTRLLRKTRNNLVNRIRTN